MRIIYKTKIFKNTCGVDCIALKRNWVRTDFSGEHRSSNANIFPAVLKRMMKELTKGKNWYAVDNLPSFIKIEEAGFLHVVSIQLA